MKRAGLMAAALMLVLGGTAAFGADVFTIFSHGTRRHRASHDAEIIAQFGGAYWGRGDAVYADGEDLPFPDGDPAADFYKSQYQKSFLILDGPGISSIKGADGQKKTITYQSHPLHAPCGDFFPQHLHKPVKPDTGGDQKKTSNANRVSGMIPFPSANRGDVYGDGWDENVGHAIFVLDELHKQGKFPAKINMIGWSRGAVTCIKLANAIDTYFVKGLPFKYPSDYSKGYAASNMAVLLDRPGRKKISASKIQINMFLIDPVPGRFGTIGSAPGSDKNKEIFPVDEKDYQAFPDFVKNVIITMANDEQRTGFAPLDAADIKFGANTNVVWLPFPGDHALQAIARHEPLSSEPVDFDVKIPVVEFEELLPRSPTEEEDVSAVARIVWDLAWQFLRFHGTEFKTEPRSYTFTPQQLVELYSDIWLKRELYHKDHAWANRIKGGGNGPRLYTGYKFKDHAREELFASKLGVYVKSPGFFINEHHRAVFERTFPNLYKYLVGVTVAKKASGGSSYEVPAEVTKELDTLADDSRLWAQLEKLGMTYAEKLESGKGKSTTRSSYKTPLNFQFGDKLGEAMFDGKPPEKSKFTGTLSKVGL